jgi:uncharacterized membrane protein YraQ (UPF0718 family)
MIHDFATWLVRDVLGLSTEARWGAALHFFVYDTLKIMFLLAAMTLAMGTLNSYMPVERVRAVLAGRRWFGLDHFVAALFGALTPFCSCSSIPLFIGFVRGGIPLGVTFSFLITSPLVNEAAVAVFAGTFGWTVTGIYAGSGIAMGTLLGFVLSRFRLERFVEPWVFEVPVAATDGAGDRRTFRQRLPSIFNEAWLTARKVAPYVFVGIAIGAAMHGFVPTGAFEGALERDNVFAVPLAVVVGVPLYANATGVIPIVEQLVAKGIPIGTALAFMMAVVGLSIPEGLLLRRVLRPRLVAIYFGSVALAIVALGYLFNALLE